MSPPPNPNSAPASPWPRLLRRALSGSTPPLGFSSQPPCYAPSWKPSPNLLPRPLLTGAALVPLAGIVLSFFLSPPFSPQCRPNPHISQPSSSSLQDSSSQKSNSEPQLGRVQRKPQSQLRPSPALNSASCLPSFPPPSALGCVVLAQV